MEIHIDKDALKNQMANEMMLNLTLLISDTTDENKLLLKRCLKPFLNRGIDLQTAADILVEICNAMGDGGKNNDSD